VPWYAPWNKQAPTSQPAPTPTAPASEWPNPLAAQLSQLTADLSALRLEWSEVLDKLNRWTKRQSARDRREVNSGLAHLGEDGPEMAEDAPGATNGHDPAPGSPEARLAAKAALRSRLRR
jgi:hypothetical protein